MAQAEAHPRSHSHSNRLSLRAQSGLWCLETHHHRLPPRWTPESDLFTSHLFAEEIPRMLPLYGPLKLNVLCVRFDVLFTVSREERNEFSKFGLNVVLNAVWSTLR